MAVSVSSLFGAQMALSKMSVRMGLTFAICDALRTECNLYYFCFKILTKVIIGRIVVAKVIAPFITIYASLKTDKTLKWN